MEDQEIYFDKSIQFQEVLYFRYFQQLKQAYVPSIVNAPFSPLHQRQLNPSDASCLNKDSKASTIGELLNKLFGERENTLIDDSLFIPAILRIDYCVTSRLSKFGPAHVTLPWLRHGTAIIVRLVRSYLFSTSQTSMRSRKPHESKEIDIAI